jgi:D-serine deaminase-like pyridoxal phosphate-dependent protein
VQLLVALDSATALDALARAAVAHEREVGVLIELDLGMRRVGIGDIAEVVRLCRHCTTLDGVRWYGIMFYPGHIREHVSQQDDALARLDAALHEALAALGDGYSPLPIDT